MFIEELPPFFDDWSKIFHAMLDTVVNVRDEKGNKAIKNIRKEFARKPGVTCGAKNAGKC